MIVHHEHSRRPICGFDFSRNKDGAKPQSFVPAVNTCPNGVPKITLAPDATENTVVGLHGLVHPRAGKRYQLQTVVAVHGTLLFGTQGLEGLAPVVYPLVMPDVVIVGCSE